MKRALLLVLLSSIASAQSVPVPKDAGSKRDCDALAAACARKYPASKMCQCYRIRCSKADVRPDDTCAQ